MGELKVRVADFKRAAKILLYKQSPITAAQLAKEMGKTGEYVNQVFAALPWLKVELNVTSVKDLLYTQYVEAIRAVIKAGITPSYSAVAHKLGMNEKKVHTYLERHPKIQDEFGIISFSPLYVYNKAAYFKERIETLERCGVQVTPSSYASAYGVDRSYVYRVIHENEEVARLFNLHKLYRSSSSETPDPQT